ncbi:hypothetical protein, partial [Acinetobacter nosocomialis]|uniref:hypothetical protein n=1 Tax=Acinetobacter nosocomialis TaxID=106654 RepID=UPI001C09EC2D
MSNPIIWPASGGSDSRVAVNQSIVTDDPSPFVRKRACPPHRPGCGGGDARGAPLRSRAGACGGETAAGRPMAR